MLFVRMRPYIELLLGNTQSGFRQGRSTLSQILVILIEGIKDQNLETVITFLESIDSIHRGKLMQIFRAYFIPDTIKNRNIKKAEQQVS